MEAVASVEEAEAATGEDSEVVTVAAEAASEAVEVLPWVATGEVVVVAVAVAGGAL